MIINSYGPVNISPEKKKKKWLFFEREGKEKGQVKRHLIKLITHCSFGNSPLHNFSLYHHTEPAEDPKHMLLPAREHCPVLQG